MARLIGPSEASREVKTIVTSAGVTRDLFKSKKGRPATFYLDEAATQVADILLEDGTAVADGTVTIDAYSMLPLIQFPDGVDTLYAVIDGGPAWPVYAREDDRFDALSTAVQAAQSAASGALVKTNNLSDLGSASTARTNLGLGTAATRNVGTASGDVAAGDAPATAQAAAIAAAATDATSKANAAQSAAISVAATDATSKANAAQSAAISAAATDATAKANAAQATAVQRANHTGTQSADTLTDGTTNKAFLATERTKLAGIATGATANATDAQLRDRSTHTGTQPTSSISGLDTALAAKVAKDELVINVMDSGAAGDGTTDDAAAVQAALNKVPAAGATVLFPAGKTFVIGTSCTVKANTTISGYGATLLAKAGTNGVRLLFASEVSGVTVQGLTLDLNKANTTDPSATTAGIGLYFHSTSGFTGHRVRDCTVKNSHPNSPAIRFSTGQSAVTDPDSLATASFTVENCRILDCGRAIFSAYVTDARIVNNEVVTTSTDAITVSVGARPYIAGNRVSGAGKHGILTEYVKRAQIVGNTCNGSAQWGIALGGGSTSISPNLHVTVTGNTCIGNGRGGITVDPTITGALTTPVKTDVTLTGNTCSYGGLYHGIYLNNVNGAAVNGNICNNNPDSGIAITGSNAAVSGNTCQTNGINGIAFYYTSGTGHGNHYVGVNNVLNNASKGYHQSGGISGISFALTGFTDVRNHGAKGDGVTNDSAAFQAAVASLGSDGGTILVPQGQYRLNTPVVTKNNVTWQGDGPGSTVINSYGGAFTWTGGELAYGRWLDLQIVNRTSGHIFTSTQGLSLCNWERCEFIQYADNYGILSLINIVDYIKATVRDCKMRRFATATVPAWQVISTAGALNSNLWENLTVYGGDVGGTTPFFYIEKTGGGNYCRDNTFFEVLGEQNQAGLIHAYSTFNLTVENCYDWDLTGSYTGSIIKVGKSASPGSLISINAKVKNCGRRGGTLGAGAYDVEFVTGEVAQSDIIHCNAGVTAGSLKFDPTARINVISAPFTSWPGQPATVASSYGEVQQFRRGVYVGNVSVSSGTGSPNGVVTGSVGDRYFREDGGSGLFSEYVKQSGTATNTGWVPRGPVVRPLDAGMWRTTLGGATATSTYTANLERAQLVELAPQTVIDRIAVSVTGAAAGSVVRLGARVDNGGRPGDLLADFGTVDSSTTGLKEITINFTVPEGSPRLWVSSTAQGGSPVLATRLLSGSATDAISITEALSSTPASLQQTGVTGALPTTFTLNSASTVATLIAVRGSVS